MVNTRAARRDITPPDRIPYCEHTTRKRQRFYNALDDKKLGQSIRSIEHDVGIAYSTGQDWIKQREHLGRDIYYRTRKVSKNLGLYPRYSPEVYQRLVNPDLNPKEFTSIYKGNSAL
ncbi:hypothetical protein ACMFMF_006358 [Clarireedia jacksonii]